MSDRWVVVRQIPEGMDLGRDYVALPDNYGTDAYFQREDICLIRKTVFDCLDRLEEHLHFTPALSASTRAVIKPNLVSVYHPADWPGRITRSPRTPEYWMQLWSGFCAFSQTF